MAITISNPPARCLDLTRLISRAGRGPLTGVDRVELEYLNHLLSDQTPLFGLVRVAPGFALLDQTGLQQIADRFANKTAWGPLDALARLRRKASEQQRRANADIRRLSIARGRRKTFGKILGQFLPTGTYYFNVGHSNLNQDMFTAIRCIPDAKVTILIHDTIPLDFPHFQREGTVKKFETKLHLVRQHADQIIAISRTASMDIRCHLSQWGQVPDITVAPLGIKTASPQSGVLPTPVAIQPYFVTLGTIEPRKNHSLLLDIWGNLAKTTNPPHLYIVGQRGWNNRTVFDRLDAKPSNVTELNSLSDGGVSTLLQDAKALLFPSHAEGFGLPLAEAMALKTPVICSDLPVFHELFGNYPVYADTTDMYSWEQAIKECATGTGIPPKQRQISTTEADPLNWENHFKIVLKRT